MQQATVHCNAALGTWHLPEEKTTGVMNRVLQDWNGQAEYRKAGTHLIYIHTIYYIYTQGSLIETGANVSLAVEACAVKRQGWGGNCSSKVTGAVPTCTAQLKPPVQACIHAQIDMCKCRPVCPHLCANILLLRCSVVRIPSTCQQRMGLHLLCRASRASNRPTRKNQQCSCQL